MEEGKVGRILFADDLDNSIGNSCLHRRDGLWQSHQALSASFGELCCAEAYFARISLTPSLVIVMLRRAIASAIWPKVFPTLLRAIIWLIAICLACLGVASWQSMPSNGLGRSKIPR